MYIPSLRIYNYFGIILNLIIQVQFYNYKFLFGIWGVNHELGTVTNYSKRKKIHLIVLYSLA